MLWFFHNGSMVGLCVSSNGASETLAPAMTAATQCLCRWCAAWQVMPQKGAI